MKIKIISFLTLTLVGCTAKQPDNKQYFSNNEPKTTIKPSFGTNENNEKKLLELPDITGDNNVIYHKGMTLSFNTEHNNPNWVAWELTREETKGRLNRSSEFFPDPKVAKKHRIIPSDYRKSGYSRGHMCPAGDMKWDKEAMKSCFYMSNMCPQTHALNAESWERLESSCRRWARKEGSIYIVCGPLYDPDEPRKIGFEREISVPTGFFKCVLSLKKGHEKAIGFVYSNNDIDQPMEKTAKSVDEIEAITGYNFFAYIDKTIEKRVEARFNLNSWD